MKRVTDFFTPVAKKPKSKSSENLDVSKEFTNTKSKSLDSADPPKLESHETKETAPKTNEEDSFVAQLDAETKDLLDLEIKTLHSSYFQHLKPQLTSPYFLSLKKFLKSRNQSGQKVFPPSEDIYSWSHLTPLNEVKVLILGQDPYHNDNQAHGLAFSVRPPTKTPPSLINIYKELEQCYTDFKRPNHGYLVPWAKQGVLLLNACLTVDAHKPNSHAKKGWEIFTQQVINQILKVNPHLVVMAWGTPAANRIDKATVKPTHLVLKSVHPSPLSASRGWFGTKHFVKANEYLKKCGETEINWCL